MPTRMSAPSPEPAAAPASEGWSLHVVRGPGRGTRIALVLAETLLGRLASNGVVLDDPSVSRVHARLRLVDGVPEFEDLQSSSGTRVNGVPLRGTVRLHDGDEIVLGRVALVLAGPG